MIADDWRAARFPEGTGEVDRDPAGMARDDVDALRQVGLSDPEIHDATQVVSYFNYINRVADALGIDPEPDWE